MNVVHVEFLLGKPFEKVEVKGEVVGVADIIDHKAAVGADRSIHDAQRRQQILAHL